MSESRDAKSGATNPQNRRESDQSGRSGGVVSGGRRKSDRPRTLPRSNVAKLAIACSFFFSAGLMAWAFTLPFRSGSLSGNSIPSNLPPAELAKLEYEARLSPMEYVEFTREKDVRLLDQVADKYYQEELKESSYQNRQKWRERVEKRKAQLDEMRKELGEKKFMKGTIEWQNEQGLQKVIDDAPPGA